VISDHTFLVKKKSIYGFWGWLGKNSANSKPLKAVIPQIVDKTGIIQKPLRVAILFFGLFFK